MTVDPEGDRVSQTGAGGNSLSVASESRRSRRIPFVDLAGLLGICGVFIATLTFLGMLRFENFYTTNWDLGINQQLLWTTTHGRLMYETGDAEFYGTRSFLQVHPAYVAFLIAPVYAAAPYPWTLFILQSGVFVASAIPLYLLARPVFEDRRWIFLGLVLYLASFPVISGILYDFHWEAFMPLEFLTFFYLFRTRRAGWSLVPLATGILTLEVFPFLVGGAAVLVLCERLQAIGFRWRKLVHDRSTQIAIVLLLAMLIVYVVQRVVQVVVISAVVGHTGSASPVSGAITSILAVNVTAGSLLLSTNYWLLMLAAFALLPLFAPRYLLLVLPWFVYSVFLSPFFSSQYGDQYALVAVATLSVPLIYGLARVAQLARGSREWTLPLATLVSSSIAFLLVGWFWSRSLLSRSVPWPAYFLLVVPVVFVVYSVWRESYPPKGLTKSPVPTRLRGRWRSRIRPRGVIVAGALVVFVAFNLAMSPLNTANLMATDYPGYWLKYSPNPLSAEMPWITGFIPANAVVLTSDFLFTYIANNPHSWAVPWYPLVPGQPPLYFPFNATNLPQYVLIDQADWFNFPASITSQLADSSTYGLIAFVFSSDWPGTISLYERGYTGQSAGRYLGTYPTVYYYTATNLTVGPSGRVQANASAKFGLEIASHSISNPTPINTAIWYGPYVSLPPGTYVITANLTGSLAPGGNRSDPILTMNGGPYFVPPIYNISVYSWELNRTGWTDITWIMDLTAALPILEFRGYLDYYGGEANGRVSLNYLQVEG